MWFKRRMCGLILLSFGTGMFIGLVLNGWAFLVAGFLLIFGFWLLFMC